VRLKNDPNIVTAPVGTVFLASAMNILGEEMGFRASAESNEGQLGKDAAPIFSYALIEYLNGLDLSGFDVLEIGGGGSTAFWVERARSVTTLETDAAWAETARARNPRATIEIATPAELAGRIQTFERSFGVIVIDPKANRLACARASTPKLAPGGFIILDNSDWYPNASRALREAGLIEIDFHDFRPAHHFRATTSIYLHPEFRPRPKQDRLPLTPIGGKYIPNNRLDLEP
jgi:hypothetical protein